MCQLGDWTGHPVTTLALWNKHKEGVLVAGFGSGHIRLFSLGEGRLLCEVGAGLAR